VTDTGQNNSSWMDLIFCTAAAEGESDTKRTVRGENMMRKHLHQTYYLVDVTITFFTNLHPTNVFA